MVPAYCFLLSSTVLPVFAGATPCAYILRVDHSLFIFVFTAVLFFIISMSNCFYSEENWEPKRLLLPCPVPLMMPAPMAMYTTPTPFPIIIPVPIPVPCFIPTSRKTSKKIFKKIKVSIIINSLYSFRKNWDVWISHAWLHDFLCTISCCNWLVLNIVSIDERLLQYSSTVWWLNLYYYYYYYIYSYLNPTQVSSKRHGKSAQNSNKIA